MAVQPYGLTPREVEVLDALAHAESRDMAALALGIAEPTFKWHLARVYRKLGVNSDLRAMVLALQSGVVRLDAKAA